MRTSEITDLAPVPPAAVTSDATWGSLPAWIDDCGLLHVGRRWVALPDIEWHLMEPLIARFGMTVRRDALIEAAWPHGGAKDSALNVRIGSVRRRIEPLGLQITNVRGRGYVLDHAAS